MNVYYREYGIFKLMKLNIFLISFVNLCFEKYLYILLFLYYIIDKKLFINNNR